MVYINRMVRYGQYIVPLAKKCVNFRVGQPAPSLLPLNLIREAAECKFKETDPLLLQYGDIPGYSDFRVSLSKFLTKNYNRNVHADNLFVTNGVSGGLSLLCSLFLKPGDVVFVEKPTYFLALSIFRDYGVKCIEIDMDTDGIVIDDLRTKLIQYKPKFLYIVPTAHNPTGRTTSLEKRIELIKYSEDHDFKIIADEVYQMLTFPHVKPLRSMCSFYSNNIISTGSFSKILAPALRLGWIETTSEEVMTKLKTCGQLDSSGGMNPVISSLVHVLLDNGKQQEHLDSTRDILWERAQAMMQAIDEHLVPLGCTYEVPEGGYFIYVRFPYDAKLWINEDVTFLTFDSDKNVARLSFSYYTKEEIKEGIERICHNFYLC